MAKEAAYESIMPPAKMKPLLALSKREPVQAAFCLTSEGDAVLLLDKKMKPRKVMATLKASAGKAKIALQPSTMRFGRAEVDTDYDPTMVRFFLNKEAPGMARIKLVEIMKKAAYQKVELNVDASLEEESEEEAEGEATAEAAPGQAGSDDEAGLRQTLAELVKRIPGAAGDDAGRRTTLLKAAAVVNDGIKSNDLAHAKEALDKLSKAIGALAGQGAARKPGNEPLLPIWLEAKGKVDDQIGKLQSALKEFDDPDLSRIAEFGLNGITGTNSVGLMVALREADAQAGGPAAKAKLTKAIESYRAFLDGDTVVKLIDANPFGVSASLRSTLGAALDTLSERIAA